MSMPHLADDERFATLSLRLKNQNALDDVIRQWTSPQDNYEVFHLLQGKSIPAGPVFDCGADTLEDPHLQARDYFQVVTHPDAGTYPMSGPIWSFLDYEHSQASIEHEPIQREKRHEHAPLLGEHNAYLLGEVLGYSDERMQKLEERQVIGTVPLEGADMGGVRRVQRESR